MDEVPPVRKRNYAVDFLVVSFGVGSWIGVTSAYLQVPLIVETAPEGWALSSQMSIIVQSATIVSFIYLLCQQLTQNCSQRSFNVAPLIYGIMVVGCIATLCMSLMYQQTTIIAGSAHSVAWLVNMFLFALVGCLSTVVSMPFMGRFREIYLVTYIFGQGFNGIPPSILAFIQGIGGPAQCIPNNNATDGPAPTFIEEVPKPLFSPQIFFLVIFAVMVASTLSFYLLNNLKICKNELAVGDLDGNDYCYDKDEKDNEGDAPVPEDVKNLSIVNYVFLIAAEATLCCIGNGFFPGIQIYSSRPYGVWPYHLTVNLAAIANPVGCFIAMFLPRTSICQIRILAACCFVLAVYIVFVALKSPHPPLIDSIFGPTIIVFCWTAFSSIMNYMKITIISIFRYQEGKSLVLVGIVGQGSAAIGSIIGFVLINYTDTFKPIESC